MKRFIILLFFIGNSILYSQVGIGTELPNASSILDIVSENKGILIPRIALTGSEDSSTINGGNVKSLLVFNTATVADIDQGFYYWNDTKWVKLAQQDDLNLLETITKFQLNADGKTLEYIDENGTTTSIDLSIIGGANILTSLVIDATAGKLVYTDENNTAKDIDLISLLKAHETVTVVNINTNDNGTPTDTLDDFQELIYKDEEGVDNKFNLSGAIELKEPWFGQNGTAADATDDKGAISNTENIYTLGRVGIGLTNPSVQLDVAGGDVQFENYPNTRDDTGTTAIKNLLYTDVEGNILSAPAIALEGDLRLVGVSNHISNDAGVGSNGTNVGAGTRNTAIGPAALSSILTGFDNIAIGFNTLSAATGAKNNIALGWSALSSYISGAANIAIGNSTLRYHETGSQNVAVGYAALHKHTDGVGNTAINSKALQNLLTGAYNIAIGVESGKNLITGSNNTIIGNGISFPNTTASNQLNIGNLIYGTNVDGAGAVLSTGNIGVGVQDPSAKLEVASGAANTSGLRITNMTSAAPEILPTNTEQVVSAIGVDAEGDIVPVMRNETVFVGKVSEGSSIPIGYQNLPLDAVYDPLNQWNNTTHVWQIPNDNFIYEYVISLNRYSHANGDFTYFRPNSATIIPIDTSTGQRFAFSYSGITSGNIGSSGLQNQYNGIPIKLNNASGTTVTLSGIEFQRGYWTLTIKRIGKF